MHLKPPPSYTHCQGHPPPFRPPPPRSIIKTALRMNEQSSMDVSEQQFVQLSQHSRTARGVMVHSDPGRHLFDTTMFRLVWGPAVHALCSIVDNVNNEQLVEQALNGLQVGVGGWGGCLGDQVAGSVQS